MMKKELGVFMNEWNIEELRIIDYGLLGGVEKMQRTKRTYLLHRASRLEM